MPTNHTTAFTTDFRDLTVTEPKLATDSVTSAKILDGNVLSAKIGDNQITNAKIDDGAVTNTKIAPEAVSGAKIGADQVLTGKVQDLAVTGAKTADHTITSLQLSQPLAASGATDAAGSYVNVTLKVDAAGRITNIANGETNTLRTDNFVFDEIPTGTVNGTNDTFTLAATPTAGSVVVTKNGLHQLGGAGNDYTISGDTITFLSGNIPVSGDNILVDYMVD